MKRDENSRERWGVSWSGRYWTMVGILGDLHEISYTVFQLYKAHPVPQQLLDCMIQRSLGQTPNKVSISLLTSNSGSLLVLQAFSKWPTVKRHEYIQKHTIWVYGSNICFTKCEFFFHTNCLVATSISSKTDTLLLSTFTAHNDRVKFRSYVYFLYFLQIKACNLSVNKKANTVVALQIVLIYIHFT